MNCHYAKLNHSRGAHSAYHIGKIGSYTGLGPRSWGKRTWRGFRRETLKVRKMCKLLLLQEQRGWRTNIINSTSDQAEDFRIIIRNFGQHIIHIIPLHHYCLCHGIHSQVRLVTHHGFILIHGCIIILYIMKGYYQIILHLISCNFVANPRGRILGIHNQIWCFVYFGYAYFGGWIMHAPRGKDVWPIFLLSSWDRYIIMAGVVF